MPSETEAAPPEPVFDFRLYVEALGDSSKRVRWVVFVLIIASVATFVTEWNVQNYGWLKRRIQVASDTLEYEYGLKDRWQAKDADDPRWLWVDQQRQKAAPHPNTSSKLNTRPPTTQPVLENVKDATEHDDRIQSAKRFYESNDRAKDVERLTKYREGLEDAYVHDALFVSIPIFGVKFDINDIGMISGFAFTIILAMLRFSIARDSANLKTAIGEAWRQKVHCRAYHLLAMSQVLIMPPPLHGCRPRYYGFWSLLPKIIFALPLLVHLFTTSVDLQTMQVGFALSTGHMIGLLICEAFFLGIIIILTYQCFYFSAERDRAWQGWAKELRCVCKPEPEYQQRRCSDDK